MTEPTRQDTQRIAEEAAEWLEELRSGDPQTHAGFAAWIRRSPRHIEEFLLMKALDSEGARIDPERRLSVEDILAEARENVVALKKVAPTRARRSSTWINARWIAVAAVLVAALGIGWLVKAPLSGQRLVTDVGEQRAVELDDGSIVQLNARTRLEVAFSHRRREIRLLEGEAFFKVAHDTSRPFVVHSGAAVIQAVGTQFNVYRHENSTTVSVIEGRVKVSPAATDSAPIFSAGEEARVATAGTLLRAPADVAAATAWRQRRLVFRSNPLSEIVSEFNRYNRGTQILIEGEAVRARRYGGTFDADDPQSFIDFLRPDENLEIVARPGEIRIRAR